MYAASVVHREISSGAGLTVLPNSSSFTMTWGAIASQLSCWHVTMRCLLHGCSVQIWSYWQTMQIQLSWRLDAVSSLHFSELNKPSADLRALELATTLKEVYTIALQNMPV